MFIADNNSVIIIICEFTRRTVSASRLNLFYMLFSFFSFLSMYISVCLSYISAFVGE